VAFPTIWNILFTLFLEHFIEILHPGIIFQLVAGRAVDLLVLFEVGVFVECSAGLVMATIAGDVSVHRSR